MASIFSDFDLTDFWEHSDYARRNYEEPSPTPQQVIEVETRLGYKLPRAYVELALHQNGGLLRKSRWPLKDSASGARIQISEILSIGSQSTYSLCGKFGSQFYIDNWGYPPIGVYFANCPSAGHDLVCLDYRACGPRGEPQVVHVFQEGDYAITFVAPSFEAFIRGLEPEEAVSP